MFHSLALIVGLTAPLAPAVDPLATIVSVHAPLGCATFGRGAGGEAGRSSACEAPGVAAHTHAAVFARGLGGRSASWSTARIASARPAAARPSFLFGRGLGGRPPLAEEHAPSAPEPPHRDPLSGGLALDALPVPAAPSTRVAGARRSIAPAMPAISALLSVVVPADALCARVETASFFFVRRLAAEPDAPRGPPSSASNS
jgi:hypothetical protein